MSAPPPGLRCGAGVGPCVVGRRSSSSTSDEEKKSRLEEGQPARTKESEFVIEVPHPIPECLRTTCPLVGWRRA